MEAHAATPQQEAQPHPIAAGMRARDAEAMSATLAEDVVLRSPVTAFPLEGRPAVTTLLAVLAEKYETWELRGELRDGDRQVLFVRFRIGGRDVDIVDEMRIDESGKVAELRIHGRPLAGIAAIAAVVGPPLARRRGPLRALVVKLITAPLPALLAAGDRLVAALALPRG